jgi:hypothetical protein
MNFKNTLIIILFFLTACEPVLESQVDKHFKESKFEYISTQYGEVKVKLPPCFIEIQDYNFSLTNEHRYECERFNLYFSLDVLTKKDLGRISSDEVSNSHQLLEYLAKLRAAEFYDISTGIVSKSQLANSCQQYQVFQYGKFYQQNDELLFWSTAMECKNGFYVIQFICVKDDFALYEKHFKHILKTIEVL